MYNSWYECGALDLGFLRVTLLPARPAGQVCPVMLSAVPYNCLGSQAPPELSCDAEHPLGCCKSERVDTLAGKAPPEGARKDATWRYKMR